jgi:hypothetical protein
MTSMPETPVQVVAQDGAPWVLLGVAVAYHQASYAIAMSIRQRVAELLRKNKPVNDAQLVEWMRDFDGMQARASRQQQALTRSWARASLAQFGVRDTPRHAEIVVKPERVEPLVRWLSQPSGIPSLDPDLTREAEALLARLDAKTATLEDLARADRIPSLHSPIVTTRIGLAEGLDLDTAVEQSVTRAGSIIDANLRTDEAAVIDNIRWPTFKDGTAMMAKRVPNAGACGWCKIVATRLYSLAAYKRGGAWHDHCRCTFALVTEAEAKAYRKAQGDTANYYAGAKAIGMWDGPTSGVDYQAFIRDNPATGGGSGIIRPATAAATKKASAPVTRASVSNPLKVGAITPQRLAAVERQLKTYQRQLADGTATAWTREQIQRLLAEHEDLRRALGA